MPLSTARSIFPALFLLAACASSASDDELVLNPPEQPAQAARGVCPDEPALDLELPSWDLYLSTEAWETLHRDVNASVEVRALLCIQGRPYPLVLELQGASSRKHLKKSFDLKFTQTAPLEGAPFGTSEALPRILLKGMANDQTLIREALGFAAWRGLGHLAPRVSFANLRINGHYWGVYNLVEPIDRDFIARHGFVPGGHLYKGVRTKYGRADFKPGRDLRDCFEDKSDPSSDWSDLKKLAEKLQRTPLRADAFARDVDAVLPLASYIDRLIWIAVTQNSDAVAQNFYLYNEPGHGRDTWTMLPWDSNVSFGAHWSRPYVVVEPDEWPLVDSANYVSGRLLSVTELRAQYIVRARELLQAELSVDTLLAHQAKLAARVRHDLARDQTRWQREVPPDEAFEVLERFLRERPDVLHQALETLEGAASSDALDGGARDAGVGTADDGDETD
jgi:hypothetical protein